MRFDFWNNPLVVTAMRLRYRRSSPGVWAVLWLLALLGVGAILHYASQQNGFRFPAAYLIAIVGIQTGLSAVMAVITVGSSMNAEVINRTLDFQRIVTLSPRAILLGKMIGEPAMSYLLIVASTPLAVLCWGLGAASGGVIFWLYVNIVTSTLMWASMGLINSLTPPTQTGGRQKAGGGGAGGIALFFAVVPQLVIHGGRMIDEPGVGDALKMLTPMGTLLHLWRDSAWNSYVGLWNLRFPSLLLAPAVQLAVAAWIVAAMTRRLKSPLDPLVGKPRAYATVAVLDLIIAGICFAGWLDGYDAAKLLYGYALAHLVVTLVMTAFVVPKRPALLSWLWRGGQQRPRLRELLTADRSPITGAAIVFGLIGLAVLLAALVAPMMLMPAAGRSTVLPGQLIEVGAAMLVIGVAVSLLHQMFVATMSRGGHVFFILLVALANILPPIAAASLQVAELNFNVSDELREQLAATSPVALFGMNLSSIANTGPHAGPAIAVYACLGLVALLLLRRVLRNEAATVERKLHSMGLAT